MNLLSLQNKLKLVRNLIEKRSARRREKLFVVEGPRLVEEALGRIKFIIYCENIASVKNYERRGIVCHKIPRAQYAKLTAVESPQGILAVVRGLDFTLNDMLKGDSTLIVFCIGIQDPGNLGTLIRSADALGAAGIILSKGTADLYNPKVVRSTMGSIFHLPIIIVENEKEIIGKLRQNNVKIIAASLSAAKNCRDCDLTKKNAVLVGNEGRGLSKEVLSLADESLLIPMEGRAESLNAGVAISIILYEAMRQRSCARKN